VVPKHVMHDLVRSGKIVIAAGGGGIPVIINGRGLFQGVEAVIDKDYTSGLIARETRTDLFIILTNVPQVYLNFGTPREKPILEMPVDEAKQQMAREQFPPGSMGPKIEAAIDYIEGGGKEVLITSASYLKAAMIHRSGTRIFGPNEET